MTRIGIAVTVDGWNSGTKDPAGWECYEDRTKALRHYGHLCDRFRGKDKVVDMQRVIISSYSLMSNRVYFDE